MLLHSNKDRFKIAALVVAASFLLILGWSQYFLIRDSSHVSFQSSSGPGPTNSTLGFGAVYVLTEDPMTWRMQGLEQAAQLAGLQLRVVVREPDEAFEQANYKPHEYGWGPIRCFLGHLKILEQVAQQDEFDTALVLEDDVDFGIDIKEQMRLLSNAIWDRAGVLSRTEEDVNIDPYRQDEWDLFWLGHWGMEFVSGSNVFKYRDSHALPWNRLQSTFNSYYRDQAAQETPENPAPQQVVYNMAAMTTFAYATTRSHAARLVSRLPDKYLQHAVQIDLGLHLDCKGGSHRCVAPVPALFQHQRVTGGTRIEDKGEQGVKQDLEWYQNRHKFTYNIEWSARCNAIGTGERVHDRWQCLPNPGDPI